MSISLKEVHNVYNKWLHIEDDRRIDVVLAVALSRKLEGTPLWLIIVGPSGDWKTEQLISFIDGITTKVIHQFTARTLVSGFAAHADLAPELDNKIMIIPDFAQILKLHPNEKAQVWAQLRDLYDGRAGKQTGSGVDVTYDNLRVTMLAASTPVIDSQILIHQDLGTRELVWRTNGCTSEIDLMKKVSINEEHEKDMRLDISLHTKAFLHNRKIKRFEIPKAVVESLERMSLFIRKMRARAEIDSYSSELRNFVYPEQPTRIYKQLKRLYICLKSLDKDYPDERALDILKHIVLSSCDPIRVKIYNYFIEHSKEEKTINDLSESLRLGKKTILAHLNTLWHLNLLKRRCEWEERFGRVMEEWHWSLTVGVPI